MSLYVNTILDVASIAYSQQWTYFEFESEDDTHVSAKKCRDWCAIPIVPVVKQW